MRLGNQRKSITVRGASRDMNIGSRSGLVRRTVVAAAMVTLLSVGLLSLGAPAFATEVHVYSSTFAGAGKGAGVPAAAQLEAFQFGQEGEGAGQVSHPTGVAVNNDPSSLFYGDVYVADYGNRRLDRFSSSGAFQLAWGWGVATGANELQTCTTKCQAGPREEEGNLGVPAHTGAVSVPAGVAVDSNLLSSSAGDVYVLQVGEMNRVEKFGPSGEFLLMFGGDVNETTSGDVCNAGERCKLGTAGHANGEFEDLSAEGYPIAVGPGGSVYVGDRARVQVFEPSGVWRETISLASLSSTGDVTALAVNETGDIFVKDSEAPGVRELEPDGVEEGTQFDAGSPTITGIALDGSGDVFVGEFNGTKEKSIGSTHVLKYKAATGKVTGSFGSGTVRGFSGGLTFAEASDTVYMADQSGEGSSSVWALPVPPPGPSIESESATLVPPGGVLLEGSVNPEGGETQYHFEYVDEADFKASGFAHSTSTTVGSLPAGLEAQTVQAHVVGLPTSETFYYRLVVSNAESVSPAVGQERTFQSLPAATIGGEFATDVALSSATLTIEVNALGSSTEYSLEYGVGGVDEHTLIGSVGNSTTDITASRHLQELAVATTYHYRFVVHNSLGTVAGPEQTFTTQSQGGSSALIDGRSWELVSPPDKHGASIEPPEEGGQVQAAIDGSGVTYMTEAGSVNENPQGKLKRAQVLSRRGPDGWSTEDLTLPGRLPENGESAERLFEGGGFNEYHLFSPDLSSAAVEPQVFGTPPLAPGVTERTLYLREDSDGSFTPLVSPVDVPSGAKIEESNFDGVDDLDWEMHFLAATPDLAHVVFTTPMALTPEAIKEESVQEKVQENKAEIENVQSNLYEWSAGKLQLVNILPETDEHEFTHAPDEVAHGRSRTTTPPVRLAGDSGSGYPTGGAPRSVSADGRRVAWAFGEPLNGNVGFRGLYVRDMVEERTVHVGGDAVYQTMNSEGSKIFYLESGDLYVYGFEAEKSTDLTADHGAGEPNGGVQELVSDVSENGSYVYFVATSVLADGGVSGKDNLYLAHQTSEGWSITHIATLSGADRSSWYAAPSGPPVLGDVSSRVSPDGRFLVFMSEESLTGYDNTDANSGAPDEEVYSYDAQTNKLVCTSCDPTGARPTGVFDDAEGLLVDPHGAWNRTADESTNGAVEHWLAGSVPGWDDLQEQPSTYQPRYLSDSGRTFFDSPVALVPGDTNGLEDVYEFEPVGVGGCSQAMSSSDAVYVASSDGCVGLISSGTSSSESVFYDASENGDDVFFDTTSRLAPEDYDKAYDLYDAHLCGGEGVPCRTTPVSSPPCEEGESCKAAPSQQPPIFGAPPSATFNGAGNIRPMPPVTLRKATKKKTVKCRKGFTKKKNKCVKNKKSKQAKKAGHGGRTKS